MSSYKLMYHDGMGKAEVARLMFVLNDVTFEDVRITEDRWPAEKPKQPFAALPVLEVDGVTLCQEQAIERLLATRFGLYGKDELERARADMLVGCVEDMLIAMIRTTEGSEQEQAEKKRKLREEELPVMLTNLEKLMSSEGFSMGKEMMWPDLNIAHFLYFPELPYTNLGPIDLSKYPKLKAIKEKVEYHPKLAEYITGRRITQF